MDTDERGLRIERMRRNRKDTKGTEKGKSDGGGC
jgi:hypothetical protein